MTDFAAMQDFEVTNAYANVLRLTSIDAACPVVLDWSDLRWISTMRS